MISCQQYDYIEIACMYRYPVKLTLKSGSVIEGNAVDTARNSDYQECIKIKIDNEERLIVLDEIAILETTLKNPHFQSVTLT